MTSQIKKKSIFSNVDDLLGFTEKKQACSPGVLDLSVKPNQNDDNVSKPVFLYQPTPLFAALAPIALFPEHHLFHQLAESRKLGAITAGFPRHLGGLPTQVQAHKPPFPCPSMMMTNTTTNDDTSRPLQASFAHKLPQQKQEPHDTTLFQFKLPAHPPNTLSLLPSGSKSSSTARQAPRFQCPDCNRSYSTFSGLSKHRQFHCTSQLKRQFGCKFCDKQYSSLGALKMHIRTHTLPCKCQICGKAFSRPWLLQGHLRTHTGEKPFRCGHCGRAFADRSNLRAHLQTHSEIKKYRCKTCQKTFSRMSLLTKHENNGCPGLML